MDSDRRPVIGLCITCGNRLPHLKQTLPRNLTANRHYPALKVIVLDYSSQDGLGKWMRGDFHAERDAGRLVYYHHPGAPYFRMAHAKNMAHRLAIREGCDILVNLDADNFTGEAFANYVAQKFEAAEEEGEAIFLRARENHTGPAGGDVSNRIRPGTAGRIVCTAAAFLQAGGYDEKYVLHWGPDDKDFASRLENLGYARHGIHPRFLRAIWHDNDLRFAVTVAGAPTGWDDADKMYPANKDRDELGVVNYGHLGEGGVFRNFDTTPISLARLPTRVFGIGLHRTATSSLNAALKKLGLDAGHWESAKWARNIAGEMDREGRSLTLEGYYALSDMPIGPLFRELDKAYPGSKFILTIRPEADWIRSVKTHFERYAAEWDGPGDVFSNEMHRRFYGQAEFDEALFLEKYRTHNADVLEYFKHRPSDLLVMDMAKGAGWAELASFVDRPMPDELYPVEFTSRPASGN